MINFTELETNEFRTYGGANGNKICKIYQDEPYMVKIINLNEDNASIYGCVSEYIGCHIFESVGIEAQKTILGKYTVNGIDCLAVGCKDFNVAGYQLQEFLKIKNSCIDSSENGKGTSLIGILSAIEEQKKISVDELKKHFWNVFIVDAFIGNFDRHNGNWGILSNEQLKTHKIAPVYDCGSCLYSQATEKDITSILQDPVKQNSRIFTFPTSALRNESGEKINYFEYISSGENKDCTEALFRILPKINMESIKQIIDNTPMISDARKKFYFMMLQLRKERILDFSIEKLKDYKYNNHIEDDKTRKFHHRENAILNQELPQKGAIGRYQELYRNMLLEGKDKNQKHIVSKSIDAKIVARILAEEMYNKKQLRQIVAEYSPLAVSDEKYVDKTMTRAKEYKKETIREHGLGR
jgi:hypothetical protein